MRKVSAGALRWELSGRGLLWEESRAERCERTVEMSAGWRPNLVFGHDPDGGHGNFLPAAYRRILARPSWARRLEKSYTGARLLPRAGDRWRGELECATSSDALLMNVFCYPGVLRRRPVCALLDVVPGLVPEFGVRAELPMRRGEIDRTEFDMQLGTVMVEAKLTESGFGRAAQSRLERYLGVGDVFELEDLPRTGGMFAGYQLVRGVLAAVAQQGSYLVLVDGRRSDLQEICFQVLRAVRSAEARQRLQLRTWQELAAALPPMLRAFLAEKYGIVAG